MRNLGLWAAYVCFALGSAVQAAETDHDRYLRWFLEYQSELSDQEWLSINQRVFRKAGVQVDAFSMQGQPVLIPPTTYRVSGHNPPCATTPQKSDQTILSENIMTIGAAVAAFGAAWPGEPASKSLIMAVGGVIAAIGKIIGNDPYQTTSNCTFACALIPGHYSESQLDNWARISYLYREDVGSRAITVYPPGRDLSYAHIGPYSSNTTSVQVDPGNATRLLSKTREGVSDGPAGQTDCPVTLVCALAKNWSRELQPTFQLKVIMDKSHIAEKACIDISLVNKDRYVVDITNEIPGDYRALYLQWLNDRLRPPP